MTEALTELSYFIRAEKTFAVKMNKMRRRLRNPHFRLP